MHSHFQNRQLQLARTFHFYYFFTIFLFSSPPFILFTASLKPAGCLAQMPSKYVHTNSSRAGSHFSLKCPKQRLSECLILIGFLVFVLPGGRASGPHVCTGTAAVPWGHLQLNLLMLLIMYYTAHLFVCLRITKTWTHAQVVYLT